MAFGGFQGNAFQSNAFQIARPVAQQESTPGKTTKPHRWAVWTDLGYRYFDTRQAAVDFLFPEDKPAGIEVPKAAKAKFIGDAPPPPKKETPHPTPTLPQAPDNIDVGFRIAQAAFHAAKNEQQITDSFLQALKRMPIDEVPTQQTRPDLLAEGAVEIDYRAELIKRRKRQKAIAIWMMLAI